MNKSGSEPKSEEDVSAELVLKARKSCQLAEMSLGSFDDAYEKERFDKYAQQAKETALAIQDPFYRSAALHPTVLLFTKAGNSAEAKHLYGFIQDALVRSKVDEDLEALRNST